MTKQIITLAATAVLHVALLEGSAHAADGRNSDTVKVSGEAEQAYREASQDAAIQANKSAARVATSGIPNSRPASGFSASSLQFNSDLGETDVSLAFAFDLRTSKPDSDETGFATVGSTKFAVTLSTPIDKENTTSRLFSGDSLVSGSKARLSIVHFSSRLGDGRGASVMLSDAYQLCFKDQSTAWLNGRLSASAQPDQQAVTSLQRNAQVEFGTAALSGAFDGTINTLTKDLENDSESAKTLEAFVKDKCQMGGQRFGNEGELMAAYSDQADVFLAKFFPKKSKLTFMGLDASLGRDDKSFLDRTNFKLLSEPRTSWEVGAYYGWIGSDLSWSLRARAVYGQSYKDMDEAEICRTVSIPAGDECIKGPDGAPIRERTGLASIEGRKVLTVNDKTQIALAPQVTYRFEDKNIGVEVPIYLVPDEKGTLSGGIKAVYNSMGDEFAVGLFVGIPFSVFFDK